MKNVIDPVEALRELLACTGPNHSDFTSHGWRVRRAYESAEKVVAAAEAGWVLVKRDVLAWTESDGAIVHMTWEQFNAMRESVGLKSRKPPRAAMLSAASEASGSEARGDPLKQGKPDAPSVWPFGWGEVACFDHPLVFGPLLKQWGVYMRHRKYRKTIEFGIVLNGRAGGLLYDYMGSWFDRERDGPLHVPAEKDKP